MIGYILVVVAGVVISGAAALWVRSSYKRYSKKASTSGMTGAEVAHTILERNSLQNVRVEPVVG
jgi:Zn-dependent membrane protease YugP